MLSASGLAVQPLVFVADSGASESNDSTSTSGMGNGYILVFDPQSYGSRMAMSIAHGMIPGSGLDAHVSTQFAGDENDRQLVRGHDADNDRADRLDRARDESRSDADQKDQNDSLTSNRDWSRASDRSYTSSDARVKVVGKVLNAHGIRAIQVTSVEKIQDSQRIQDPQEPLASPGNTPRDQDSLKSQDSTTYPETQAPATEDSAKTEKNEQK